ncbi:MULTISPECIES: hypothetical protein [Giesbergeria]|uniref:ATPase with chaperone activity n=1 Tax=Giesbergeria sinuosa TaxID=80883 RepID=A0ABV9QCL6_9BURK
MSDSENQIFVPPSFIALYSDARGRLRERPAWVRERYELCEDLAGHLVGQAQTLYQLQVPSEFEVLRRIHAGLSSADAGLLAEESVWVVCRLAELLEWPCPELKPIASSE